MIKLNITEEMITFIKENMDRYSVKAADLAKGIKKTNAYISKFLAGDFKSLTYEDLCDMVNAICADKCESVNLVNEFLTSYILNSKQSIYYDDIGLQSFDDTIRQLSIPNQLVEYINSEMKNSNVSVKELVDRINSNSDLGDSTRDLKYEYNIYYRYETEEKEKKSFIKLKADYENINDILRKAETKCNYITVKSILYTLFRIKNNDEINSQLLAEYELNKFEFYNLYEQKLANIAKTSLEKSLSCLSDFPSEFVITIGKLIKCYDAFYKINPKYIAHKNAGLYRNIDDDPSLFISLLDAPLYKTKELEIDKKRKLVNEINELIEKYVSPQQVEDKYQII